SVDDAPGLAVTAVNLGLTVIASLAVPAAITCDRVHTWLNFDGAVTVAALTATRESHLSIDVRIRRRLFHCCGCSFVGNFRLTRRTVDFNFVRNGDPEKVIPGQWFLFIGEDNREPGCTIKGHKARYVPLHPEIVKRLIPYMESKWPNTATARCS